ncbi:MAG: hypothetical protein ACFFEK_13495, partial [Candidatus Thorarchaeota archaeon]
MAYTYRRTPITRPMYLDIIDKAERKIVMNRSVNPLLGKDTGLLITSAHTPFQTGILVSKRAAELIEEHPVEGEIVLAHELAKLKRDRIVFNILRNVGAFYYGIVFEGVFFAEFIVSIIPLLEMTPLWFPALFLTYPWGFGIALWYHQKAAAELEVEATYGMNPELATFTVFSNKHMSSVGRRHYIEEIESNIRTRQSRTWFSMIGLPLFYSSIIASIAYILVMRIPSSFTDLFVVIIGGLFFIILVYQFSRMGTQRPKRPDSYVPQPSPKAEDETSIQVAKILSRKTGNEDCEIRSSFDFEDGLDWVFYQLHTGGMVIWVSDEEWKA